MVVVVWALILLVAGAVRVWASFGDFWLDEIWSLHFATEISSPLELVSKIHHDNNHVLNTFLMYVLGDHDNWIIYRIPSLFAGILTVALSGLIGRRGSRAEAVVCLLLVGSSYLMIHYSSEARGYALAIFFAVLSFYLMQLYLDRRRWAAWLFVPAVILGFLSHLTFAHFYTAAVIWSTWRFIKDRRGWRDVFLRLLACHAVPLAFCSFYYVIHIRHIVIGGGPLYSLTNIAGRALALTLGIPGAGVAHAIAGGAGLLITCYGLAQLWRESSGLWLFYAGAIVLSPVLLTVVTPTEFLFVRYFLVSAVFFLLLFGHVLARFYTRTRWGKFACVIVILSMTGGNIVFTAQLLVRGRGNYLAAMRYIMENSPEGVVTIGSDHDFRNKAVMTFYAKHVGTGKPLKYVDAYPWPRSGVTWYVTHSLAEKPSPPPSIRDVAGNRYELMKHFPYSRLSGWHWFIYRRAN